MVYMDLPECGHIKPLEATTAGIVLEIPRDACRCPFATDLYRGIFEAR